MDLSQSFAPVESGEREPLLLTNVSYTIEERGHLVDTPVFYIRARREDGSLRTLEVEGFRPYFAISRDDFVERASDVCNDRRVLGVEVNCSPSVWADALTFETPDEATAEDVERHLSDRLGAEIYHTDDERTTLHDKPVALIYTRVPGDVGGETGLRGDLDCRTYEADIQFAKRFLISSEIYRGFEAPTGKSRVRYENWPGETTLTRDRDDDAPMLQEIAPCDAPDVDARMIVYDIEVATEGDGFPQPDRARKPVTSISAYNSYEDTYRLWGLVNREWAENAEGVIESVKKECRARDDFPTVDTFELFDSETALLADFNEWVLERDPDIFTGWNSDGFDTPYLIQRSYHKQALNIKRYSRNGNPGVWVEEYKGSRQVNFVMKDRVTLDLLDAYRKTQYRELDSYRLDAVAEAELGYGKTGLAGDELDEAWEETPIEFFTYSIRDAQATAGIERESGLLDLFENLREVTGAPYEAAVNNGPMLDVLFLRRAYEKGLVLPSNRKPDEDVYHGAKVFDPVPGKHRNSVYPDLSSMYPNLFAMLNLGEETIIGDIEALKASTYTRDDCYRFPVDERPFAVAEKGSSIGHIDREKYKGVKTPDGGLREMFDPVITWFYVLKPEVKESFIRGTVDEMIDLKYQYVGDLYEAVKRITNSIYGVAGDSASGGKGFRLYNRRVAEGITLAGRFTITHTAEEFTKYLQENYDEDSYQVGGDTDSCVTSIPGAPTLEHARAWAVEAAEFVDASYDDFAEETFEMPPEDHRLEVELESLASALFYMKGDTETSYRQTDDGLVRETETTAVKKRYAQHIVWDDADGWLDTGDDVPLDDPDDVSELKKLARVTFGAYEDGPLADQDPTDNVSIKGFELVRSDSAQITRDAQLEILTDILLAEDPKQRIESYLRELIDEIESGVVPLSDLARPSGIGQHLDDYGWKDIDELDEDDITDEVRSWGGTYVQTPGPTQRGAKYADDWLSWEELGEDSKPSKIPIDRVRGDKFPHVYEYHSYPEKNRPDPPEVGRPVDAIAVENPDKLPTDAFLVDYEEIIRNEIQGKTEDILSTIGIDWEDALAEGSQSSLDAFA